MKDNQIDPQYEPAKLSRPARELGRDFSDHDPSYAPMDEYTLFGDESDEVLEMPAEKDLKEQAEELLYLHPEFDDRYVHVAAEEGKLTLMGRVETQMDKSLAESLVMELGGVVNVINLLEVDTSDTWMNPPAGENLSKGLY